MGFRSLQDIVRGLLGSTKLYMEKQLISMGFFHNVDFYKKLRGLLGGRAISEFTNAYRKHFLNTAAHQS